MSIVNSAVMAVVHQYRRQYVGEFMDNNPTLFGAPSEANRWVDSLSRGGAVEANDRHAVERALGMFANAMRGAQHAMLAASSMRLEEFLSVENFPGIEDVVEPHPVALLIVGGEDPAEYSAETIAFARSISILRFMVHAGHLSANIICEGMCQSLIDLPGNSPVQRSLVTAARQLVQCELELMLCDKPEEYISQEEVYGNR